MEGRILAVTHLATSSHMDYVLSILNSLKDRSRIEMETSQKRLDEIRALLAFHDKKMKDPVLFKQIMEKTPRNEQFFVRVLLACRKKGHAIIPLEDHELVLKNEELNNRAKARQIGHKELIVLEDALHAERSRAMLKNKLKQKLPTALTLLGENHGIHFRQAGLEVETPPEKAIGIKLELLFVKGIRYLIKRGIPKEAFHETDKYLDEMRQMYQQHLKTAGA